MLWLFINEIERVGSIAVGSCHVSEITDIKQPTGIYFTHLRPGTVRIFPSLVSCPTMQGKLVLDLPDDPKYIPKTL